MARNAKPLYNDSMLFHVTVEQSDGWFVVECPALPGWVSQGRDEKEALENIREAIVAWLWAEDQKAAAKLTDADEIVVAVQTPWGLSATSPAATQRAHFRTRAGS
jgi:predicted RNase H-like HicB family nuclease